MTNTTQPNLETHFTGAQDQTTAEIVQGTWVDLAGFTRAKNVPARRKESFARNGLGAAKVWIVYGADNTFAENDEFSVSGDLRLHLDTSALRQLDSHVVWGPTNLTNQDGSPSEYDPRTLLQATERKLLDAGYTARFGFEFEFELLPTEIAAQRNPDIFGTPWGGYGATTFINNDEFFAELVHVTEAAGINLDQIHTEWGTYQYEVSTAPDSPVNAADKAVLLKLLLKRTAARFGLSVILSPKPYLESAGNGGHIHFSIDHAASGAHLFSGGDQVYGITQEGGWAIAGVQKHLDSLAAVLSGSPVSLLRLQPETWSGATIGWGLENRETAIRYLADTLGNPHGANIEVKSGDATANPYLAVSGLLLAALDGIENKLPLAKPTEGIPDSYDDAERAERGLHLFPSDYPSLTKFFDESEAARRFFGDGIVNAIVAIRELAWSTYKDTPDEELAYRFRNIW